MQTSKFFKSQFYDYQLPFDSNPLEFTSVELYPRIRHTEFYRQALIPEEYQVREYEHPHNLDCPGPLAMEEHKREKIIPPKNSEMRVFRDSYFS